MLLWISIKKESRNFFSLPVPIPLFVLQEIFESFFELIAIGHFFVARRTNTEVLVIAPAYQKFSFSQIDELLVFLNQLLSSLADCEPFDLVNVKTPEVEVVVKIR